MSRYCSRNCSFLITMTYTIIQLRTVHEVAPKIKLCINDYNIESVSEKSIAYAQLAKKLLDKGAPLHCIGQSPRSCFKSLLFRMR